MNCIYSAGLVITDITSSGGTVSWTDYGSVGYEWVITTSALPDGSNAVASRTGANTLATGLASGTGYIVFLRSTCGGGNSEWSSGISFITLISNDEAVNVRIVDVMGRFVAEQAMTRAIPVRTVERRHLHVDRERYPRTGSGACAVCEGMIGSE